MGPIRMCVRSSPSSGVQGTGGNPFRNRNVTEPSRRCNACSVSLLPEQDMPIPVSRSLSGFVCEQAQLRLCPALSGFTNRKGGFQVINRLGYWEDAAMGIAASFVFRGGLPPDCSCGLFLRTVPAVCSCDLFLRSAPPDCSSGLFLRSAPADCFCGSLLRGGRIRPAPARGKPFSERVFRSAECLLGTAAPAGGICGAPGREPAGHFDQ